MRCSKTAWKCVLPSLFGASMACAAWADATPTQHRMLEETRSESRDRAAGPPPGRARGALVGQTAQTCDDDLHSIWRHMRSDGSVSAPDIQGPDLRQYWVQDIDTQGKPAEHGRCATDCVALYMGAPPGTAPAHGVCRWVLGDWGDTLRFQGGCAQDRLDMLRQVHETGSISVRDALHPRSDSLLVTTIDEATVATANHACAAACSGPMLQPSVCQWSLFEWGASISARPSPAVACLADQHEMQEQLRVFDSISVPDARHPQTLRHAVDDVLGAPWAQATTCFVGCTEQSGPLATCTWTPGQWGDTIRYQGLQRDSAARY